MPQFTSTKDALHSSINDYSSCIKADGEEKKSTKSDDDFIKEIEKPSTPDNISRSSDHVPLELDWRYFIMLTTFHIGGLLGIYLMFTSAMWQTNVFLALLCITISLGTNAGAHRLWSHRTYKAKFPLRLFLAFFFTMAFEDNIYDWSINHRIHHTYAETNADPHNADRGFLFSHIGWVALKEHPDVTSKRKTIDVSDLMDDPVVRFHKTFYIPLAALLSFFLPTIIPMYFWNETFINSLCIATFFRICYIYHQTWLINSVAHKWGNRPYDININPRDVPFFNLGTAGEGYHNFHHTFPYDYSSSEYGIRYNISTAFIDLMAFFGLAYDRKSVPKSVIEARKLRTGPASLNKTVIKENDSVKSE